MFPNFRIRTATPDDAAAILAIYKPYIENTAITFEYDVPSLGLFRARIIHTLQKYPYLVAEEILRNTPQPSLVSTSPNRQTAAGGGKILTDNEDITTNSGGMQPHDGDAIMTGGDMQTHNEDAIMNGGRILGYAYASPFKERAAYQWSVETSIYVDSTLRHSGIGSALHRALEQSLRTMGILNLNACIAYPPTPLDRPIGTECVEEAGDEFLPPDSVRFHLRMGYAVVAHFHRCGLKQGRWYDMIWMEKLIGSHTSHHPLRP